MPSGIRSFFARWLGGVGKAVPNVPGLVSLSVSTARCTVVIEKTNLSVTVTTPVIAVIVTPS